MRRNSRVALALVLTLGCAAEEGVPPSFDPGAPFPTYRATGGWVTGELDGRPFTSVEIAAHAGPARRYPDYSTQTLSFHLEARDAARGITMSGDIRFFEGDYLRTGAPVLVGPFWGAPYRDPPEGGALVQFHVDVAGRDFVGGSGVGPIDLRFVDVCEGSTGTCHLRLEIEGRFEFRGMNEYVGERREARLSIGLDLEPAIASPDAFGGPTLIPNETCPPSSSDGSEPRDD